MNAISKNLDSAKKNWRETFQLMQTGKITNYFEEENKNSKNKKKKIDLVPRHRFQKDEIIPHKNDIKKRCQSANKLKKVNGQNKTLTNHYEGSTNNEIGEEDEIKMVYNTNNNVKVIGTKAKNPVTINNIPKTGKIGNIGNPMLFDKFEETLKKMQDELNNQNVPPKKINKEPQKNEENIIPQEIIEKKHTINKTTFTDKDQDFQQFENKNNQYERKENFFERKQERIHNDREDNNLNEMENDIKNKFNDLNDLDSYMKKLDMMLDHSKQNSLKIQYDLDVNKGEGIYTNDLENEEEEDYDKENINFEEQINNYQNYNNNKVSELPQEPQTNYKKPLFHELEQYKLESNNFPIRNEEEINFARSFNDGADNYNDNNYNNFNEISFKTNSNLLLNQPMNIPIQSLNNQYSNDVFEDEQPKKLSNIMPVPTYMAPPQTKTIQIQRNVISMDKKNKNYLE